MPQGSLLLPKRGTESPAAADAATTQRRALALAQPPTNAAASQEKDCNNLPVCGWGCLAEAATAVSNVHDDDRNMAAEHSIAADAVDVSLLRPLRCLDVRVEVFLMILLILSLAMYTVSSYESPSLFMCACEGMGDT